MKLSWNSEGVEAEVLRFPAKRLRAEVISEYIRHAGYPGVVVFTCGNAAKALREVLQPKKTVLEVGPCGDLITNHWWTPAQVHATFPQLFDATSGHLPLPLMVSIAHRFKEHFGYGGGLPESRYLVPTGSGETILCLKIAFPEKEFKAVYDKQNPATKREQENTVNKAVEAFFPFRYATGQLGNLT